MATRQLIDVHSHVYLPRLVSYMKARTTVPKISTIANQDRLIILPSEEQSKSTSAGRPIGKEYWSIDWRLQWMKRHGIGHSIISLANPWLDWLPAGEAAKLARELNQDMQLICDENSEELSAFGVLPLHCAIDDVLAEVDFIKQSSKLKGYILGTRGSGSGLDDKKLLPVWKAVEEAGLIGFLHPHYGIDAASYGEAENGHVLPLALGFPFETTTSISRMILAGVFDQFPALKILVAHSGGTLPFLAGRLDSCVLHDPTVKDRLKLKPSEYLKKLYYDAVIYDSTALRHTIDFAGPDRVMFGTDCPFFPPLDDPEKQWESVDWNTSAIERLGSDGAGICEVFWFLGITPLTSLDAENARAIFKLD